MVQVVGSIGRSGVVRGRVAYQGVKSTSHGGRGRATMMRGRRGVVSVGVMTPDFVCLHVSVAVSVSDEPG